MTIPVMLAEQLLEDNVCVEHDAPILLWAHRAPGTRSRLTDPPRGSQKPYRMALALLFYEALAQVEDGRRP